MHSSYRFILDDDFMTMTIFAQLRELRYCLPSKVT